MKIRKVKHPVFHRALEKFQKCGFLCDLILRSAEGRNFMTHAVVMAAASEDMATALLKCSPGKYVIETTLSNRALEVVVSLAYRGKTPHPFFAKALSKDKGDAKDVILIEDVTTDVSTLPERRCTPDSTVHDNTTRDATRKTPVNETNMLCDTSQELSTNQNKSVLPLQKELVDTNSSETQNTSKSSVELLPAESNTENGTTKSIPAGNQNKESTMSSEDTGAMGLLTSNSLYVNSRANTAPDTALHSSISQSPTYQANISSSTHLRSQTQQTTRGQSDIQIRQPATDLCRRNVLIPTETSMCTSYEQPIPSTKEQPIITAPSSSPSISTSRLTPVSNSSHQCITSPSDSNNPLSHSQNVSNLDISPYHENQLSCTKNDAPQSEKSNSSSFPRSTTTTPDPLYLMRADNPVMMKTTLLENPLSITKVSNPSFVEDAHTRGEVQTQTDTHDNTINILPMQDNSERIGAQSVFQLSESSIINIVPYENDEQEDDDEDLLITSVVEPRKRKASELESTGTRVRDPHTPAHIYPQTAPMRERNPQMNPLPPSVRESHSQSHRRSAPTRSTHPENHLQSSHMTPQMSTLLGLVQTGALEANSQRNPASSDFRPVQPRSQPVSTRTPQTHSHSAGTRVSQTHTHPAGTKHLQAHGQSPSTIPIQKHSHHTATRTPPAHSHSASKGAMQTHSHNVVNRAPQVHSHSASKSAIQTHSHDLGTKAPQAHSHSANTSAIQTHPHNVVNKAPQAHSHSANKSAIKTHSHDLGTRAPQVPSHSASKSTIQTHSHTVVTRAPQAHSLSPNPTPTQTHSHQVGMHMPPLMPSLREPQSQTDALVSRVLNTEMNTTSFSALESYSQAAHMFSARTRDPLLQMPPPPSLGATAETILETHSRTLGTRELQQLPGLPYTQSLTSLEPQTEHPHSKTNPPSILSHLSPQTWENISQPTESLDNAHTALLQDTAKQWPSYNIPTTSQNSNPYQLPGLPSGYPMPSFLQPAAPPYMSYDSSLQAPWTNSYFSSSYQQFQ